MQRSTFLGSIGGLAVVGIAPATGALAVAQTLAPTSSANAASASPRVVVVVNLQGGNDGLNTVVPYAQSAYYRYRPTLGIVPNDVLRLDANVGLNPRLAPLKALYDQGQLAVVQGVGYPKPDFSHFRSTEIWQTAIPERFESSGWLGRFLDAQARDTASVSGSATPAPRTASDLFRGVAISEVLPEALLARTVDVPAIAQLGGYALTSDRNVRARADYHAIVADDRAPFTSPYLARAGEVADHAQRGSEALPRLVAAYKPAVAYPVTPIGRSLALAAQIIGSGVGTRVIMVQQGSYDTHTGQKATQDRLLGELAQALVAFQSDLAAHGNAERALTLTFSEFGRRVGENASRGTDHGTAAPLFVLGSGITGGLYGTAPDLSTLENGNLRAGLDFRSVYATVLERWFAQPAAPILEGTFPLVPFLA